MRRENEQYKNDRERESDEFKQFITQREILALFLAQIRGYQSFFILGKIKMDEELNNLLENAVKKFLNSIFLLSKSDANKAVKTVLDEVDKISNSKIKEKVKVFLHSKELRKKIKDERENSISPEDEIEMLKTDIKKLTDVAIITETRKRIALLTAQLRQQKFFKKRSKKQGRKIVGKFTRFDPEQHDDESEDNKDESIDHDDDEHFDNDEGNYTINSEFDPANDIYEQSIFRFVKE
jgi:hypothetical protein